MTRHGWRWVALVGVVIPLGGCAAREGAVLASPSPKSPPATPQSPRPEQAPVAPAAARVIERETLLGHSVRGRPILLHTFGAGRPCLFIHGGIHGNELASVYVAQRLLDALRSDARLSADRTIGLIAVANPDGYAERKRANANGIDLNRNFPSRDFKPSRRYGAAPASQPETRAILRAMELLRPDAIITLHSITGGRECNNFDGPARGMAEFMARYNGRPVMGDLGYETPGSFGRWAGRDQGIPTLTLEFPFSDAGERSWQQNGPGLTRLLREWRPTPISAELR